VYVPAPFAESDRDVLLAFIAEHPLGALVTGSPAHGLYATHLPLLLDRTRGAHGVLHGHIARANPHHRRVDAAESGPTDALVIFSGPEAYVSPSWYAAKARHGKVVPTWNYIAVHVTGRVRFIDDRAFLMQHLDALTTEHEASHAHPWAVSDAPAEFVAQLAGAIVGVEIEIVSIEGKWKLSQNRGDDDIDGVIDGLRASASPHAHAVATHVAERRPHRDPHSV
jgi:transcriptional regulator